MTLKIVVGPPAAGKSTWIREHRKPGDITIDYDVIANALAGAEPANHEHTDIIKQVTRAARIAAIDAAGKHTDSVDVWIIHSTAAASTLDRYREQGAEVIIVDPGRDIVMHRIKHERPKHMLAAAAKWYDTQAGGGRQGSRGKPPAATRPARSTSDRGYGWDHQQQRERLLKAHVDGTPCDWCGEPMYRDKAKNFDGAALEADHEDSLKLHGKSRANRLRHRRCNRQAREGGAAREHLRPPAAASEPVTGGFDWGGLDG